MIDPSTIQKINDAASIEEVISDFVTLKKRGANYLGLCPFHNEKTPSFTVSPAKGIFKCFGCGKSGNVVGFVMEHEHYSYPEALKYLARRYGIAVEEEEVTPEMQQKLDVNESMLTLNSFVTKYFAKNLNEKSEGKSVALSYLKERGFRESTMDKFDLGYAIDGWTDYTDNAIASGYKKEVLVGTGLSIAKGDRMFDRFKGRIIFPIHNLTGRVIGFGGRILSAEKSKAKYLNSPESPIYNKSKVLYGIFFARNAIAKNNLCYLVEGYTDVISLHQNGVENVVASSGTSLTIDQIKLIKRFTPNITILYDGDAAGLKASFRGIDLILEQGMNVKVVLFPDGEDPDSFANSHTTSETEAFVKDAAVDFIKFKTSLLKDETKDDPTARASLIKDIVQSISLIPDGITRSVYVKECSVLLEMAEQTLMNELNKLLRQKFAKQNNVPNNIPETTVPAAQQFKPVENDPLDTIILERSLIRLLLLFGNEVITIAAVDEEEERETTVSKYIIEDLDNDNLNFNNEACMAIADEVRNSIKSEKELDVKYFTNHENNDISSLTIDIISSPYELSDNWEKNSIFVKKEDDDLYNFAMGSLMAFKSRLISKQLKDLASKMKDSTDDAEVFLLMQEYYELKKLANLIDAELNRPFNY